ncbi:MAG TPA: helix-turn-helix domain-containing protein [Roseiflexaceae bacterium]|nr:helix-turn-helix domain-containing protein [Roseiflexaceae bacterium]
MSEESMLTVQEVAERLRLHPRTVSNMAKRGDIPAIKIARRWRFRADVIEELYQKRQPSGSRARNTDGQ